MDLNHKLQHDRLMMLVTELAAKFLLGSGKIILYLTIVDGVPEFLVHKLDGIRGSTKGNLIRRVPPMRMSIQEVRYISPKQKGI